MNTGSPVLYLGDTSLDTAASYLGAWTVGGDWEGYSAIDTVSPFLYLSPLPLSGLLAWRGSFSLELRGPPRGSGNALNTDKEA